MTDPTTLNPFQLGRAYRALEDDNLHHDAALLVARAAENEEAVGRLTEIKHAWERGSFTGEDSAERYAISSPIFRELVDSGRLVY